jgi:hypothetical protein
MEHQHLGREQAMGKIKQKMLEEIEDPPEWETPEYLFVPTDEYKALYGVLIRADDFVGATNEIMRSVYSSFLVDAVKKYRDIEKKKKG